MVKSTIYKAQQFPKFATVGLHSNREHRYVPLSGLRNFEGDRTWDINQLPCFLVGVGSTGGE